MKIEIRNERDSRSSGDHFSTFNNYWDASDKHVEYVYNALSQVTFINRFENTTGAEPALRTKFTYDGASRMETMQHRDVDSSSTSTLLNQYEYTYDNAGRITEIDSTEDNVSTYSFDKIGQVTDADHDTGRTDETYTFDATGNRTGGDYVVSAKNRTDESTGYEYEYDKEGNRTKRTDTSDDSYEVYTFDHRNRLTDVEFYSAGHSLTKSIEYTYDMSNRMVQRTLDSNGSGSGGVTKTYWAAFDGIHATLEFDGGQETDIVARYMWGQFADDILAIEEVNSVSSAGDILWALSDQVYTVRDIGEWDSANSEFVIANHRVYNSFGELESETDSSVDFAFGFTGKWVEEETGYTHHLNRWFDPEVGKWISEDPIGFAGGDANISRYVSNNVLSRVDSNGLFGGPGFGNAEPPVSTGAGSGEGIQERQQGNGGEGGAMTLTSTGTGSGVMRQEPVPAGNDDLRVMRIDPPTKEEREDVDQFMEMREGWFTVDPYYSPGDGSPGSHAASNREAWFYLNPFNYWNGEIDDAPDTIVDRDLANLTRGAHVAVAAAVTGIVIKGALTIGPKIWNWFDDAANPGNQLPDAAQDAIKEWGGPMRNPPPQVDPFNPRIPRLPDINLPGTDGASLPVPPKNPGWWPPTDFWN